MISSNIFRSITSSSHCLLGLLLLTGCTVTSYDHYGHGGPAYPRAYGAPAAPYWAVNEDYVDYETPYYVYGGVNYFYVSGRYVYYVNGRRHYASSLPYGGRYNNHHPLYSHGPGPVRGYSGRTPYGSPAAPAYAPQYRTPAGSGWQGYRQHGSYSPAPGQPPRSYPAPPAGAAGGAPSPGSVPHQRYASPGQPQSFRQAPQGTAPTRAGGGPPASGQPGPGPGPGAAGPRSAPPTAPQDARPAPSKKKADEPEPKTNGR